MSDWITLEICYSISFDILSEVIWHHKLCDILLDQVWLNTAGDASIWEETKNFYGEQSQKCIRMEVTMIEPRQCGMCNQQSLRSAWAYAQSDQSIC